MPLSAERRHGSGEERARARYRECASWDSPMACGRQNRFQHPSRVTKFCDWRGMGKPHPCVPLKMHAKVARIEQLRGPTNWGRVITTPLPWYVYNSTTT